MLIACLVLAGLAGCVLAALARPAAWWPVGVIALAAVWPFVNKSFEGPLLWELPADAGGVTLSDLLAVGCLVLGAWLLRRRRSYRQAGRQQRPGVGWDDQPVS